MDGAVTDEVSTNGDGRYRSEPTVLVLKFDQYGDPRIADLVIRIRALSLGEWLEVGAPNKIHQAFVDALVSWNLEVRNDKGRWVKAPCTLEGLYSQEPWWVRTVTRAWQEAFADISGPLDPPSSGGDSGNAPSLPMEPLDHPPASPEN